MKTIIYGTSKLPRCLTKTVAHDCPYASRLSRNHFTQAVIWLGVPHPRSVKNNKECNINRTRTECNRVRRLRTYSPCPRPFRLTRGVSFHEEPHGSRGARAIARPTVPRLVLHLCASACPQVTAVGAHEVSTVARAGDGDRLFPSLHPSQKPKAFHLRLGSYYHYAYYKKAKKRRSVTRMTRKLGKASR